MIPFPVIRFFFVAANLGVYIPKYRRMYKKDRVRWVFIILHVIVLSIRRRLRNNCYTILTVLLIFGINVISHDIYAGTKNKKKLLIENFENMTVGESVSPAGEEKEEILLGSTVENAKWGFNAGDGTPKKWKISVISPGYESEKALRMQWDCKRGGWLSSTVYFENSITLKKPRRLVFMAQSRYMTTVGVLIGIQSRKGKEIFFERRVSISKSKKWRKITVMLRQMGVPSWYIKQYGKPSIKRFPSKAKISSLSINPGWKTQGDIKIDNIKIE